jgi:Cys-tRNA synthase (O-phospho-L-seryl-tRNA:Cys-tRNA synthase)
MRGKKTPEETKAKVIEIKLLNIGLSSYDIAKQLEGTEWEVSADTIQDIIKEFPQLTAQSEKWQKQIDRLTWIIDDIEDITNNVIKTIKTKEDLTIRDVKDLTDISKTNWERLRMLEWKPTERIAIEDLSTLTPKELEEIRSKLL